MSIFTPPSQVKIIVFAADGSEHSRWTVAEFVKANANVMRPARTWQMRIVTALAMQGQMRLNLGPCGEFVLKPEPVALPKTEAAEFGDHRTNAEIAASHPRKTSWEFKGGAS